MRAQGLVVLRLLAAADGFRPVEGDGTGYRSGDDWISVTAYERYIRDD